MIIKSLIIASIIFDLLGLKGLSNKYDQAVIRNEYNPAQIAVASNITSSLPEILPLPKVRDEAIEPLIYAKNYILVDADSGKVLLKQAAKDKVPIASTTKIMSAIIVLETYDLDDVVTISPTAANMIGATANFRIGEKLTVESLLNAMLIKSANGAAYALAEHMDNASQAPQPIPFLNDEGGNEDGSSLATSPSPLGEGRGEGSALTDEESNISTDRVSDPTEKERVAKFVEAMNAKARSLGMTDTDYHDPAGLDTTGYSSAFDLYLATKYALAIPKFAEIVKKDHEVIKNTDGKIWHDLKNSNRLVGEYRYLGALGVKTGYMPDAGHVLVSAAKRDDHTLIGVIINTYADTAPASADESKKLLDWGFNNVEW